MTDDVKALIARIQAEMESYEPSKLGDDPAEFDSWRVLYDAKAALEAATVAPAVDRDALAKLLNPDAWVDERDEHRRNMVRNVAGQIIASGLLRDVRDVQAEALEQYADDRWGPVGKRRKEENSMFGEELRIRERAQAIREARSER